METPTASSVFTNAARVMSQSAPACGCVFFTAPAWSCETFCLGVCFTRDFAMTGNSRCGLCGLFLLCALFGIRRLVPPMNRDTLFDETRALVGAGKGKPGGDPAQPALRDLRPVGAVLLRAVSRRKLAGKRLRRSGPSGGVGCHGGTQRIYARSQTCASGKTLRLVIWQDSCGRKMPARPLPLKAKEPKRPPGIPDGLWYFPRNLADHANARGLSQKQIAKMAGVKQSTISRWLAYEITSAAGPWRDGPGRGYGARSRRFDEATGTLRGREAIGPIMSA